MGKEISVLVVDDSESMRYVICATLLSMGCHVQRASDGCDALKLAKNNIFDLVITDINMPNMNGFQLIESLRALGAYKFIPILTLTTLSDKASKHKAKLAGATGWIVKPFTSDQLAELVAKLMRATAA